MHPIGQPGLEPFYNQVYKWFPGRTYNNVLIVGAGSGSDVAIALSHGAGHVDAVEIDPKLLQIGEQQHPNQPYSDPRVTRLQQRRPGLPAHDATRSTTWSSSPCPTR